MNEYRFTLQFSLLQDEVLQDELIDRLYRSDAADALIGIGHPGHIAFDFIRKDESLKDAVLSAMTDVERALPELDECYLQKASIMLNHEDNGNQVMVDLLSLLGDVEFLLDNEEL